MQDFQKILGMVAAFDDTKTSPRIIGARLTAKSLSIALEGDAARMTAIIEALDATPSLYDTLVEKYDYNPLEGTGK